MKNLDIRLKVSDLGLKYGDIAEQMGVSRQYLSLLMRFDLTTGNKARIMKAIEELCEKRKISEYSHV